MAGQQQRSIFVTGASGGIGAAVVAHYRGSGATVVTADLGGEVDHHFDVTDLAATREALAASEAAVGPLDLVVACAGMGAGGLVEEITDEQWHRTIEVNLFGTTNTVRAGYDLMRPRQAGHLVAVASLAGLVPAALLAPYGAAKHGVVGFMRALRVEAARNCVGVTVVCPGPVDTPLLDTGGAEGAGHDVDIRRYLTDSSGPAIAPSVVARALATGVRRNRLVVTPRRAGAIHVAQRLAPGLVELVTARSLAKELGHRAR